MTGEQKRNVKELRLITVDNERDEGEKEEEACAAAQVSCGHLVDGTVLPAADRGGRGRGLRGGREMSLILDMLELNAWKNNSLMEMSWSLWRWGLSGKEPLV